MQLRERGGKSYKAVPREAAKRRPETIAENCRKRRCCNRLWEFRAIDFKSKSDGEDTLARWLLYVLSATDG